MFYMTLPSNASMDVYPDNKISHYFTQLPQEINLRDEGEHEMALVEINYVHSIYNVDGEECWMQYRANGLNYNLQLSPGHYKPSTLIDGLNKIVQSLSETTAREYLKFYYNPINQKASLFLSNENTKLQISERLQRILKFEERKMSGNRSYFGQGVVSLDDKLSCLYVYCDLVKERIVGDKLTPLLRIAPLVGKEGQVVYKSFSTPHYLPLSRQQFRTVEILVADDTGKAVRFESGRIVVTLHFRQRQL